MAKSPRDALGMWSTPCGKRNAICKRRVTHAAWCKVERVLARETASPRKNVASVLGLPINCPGRTSRIRRWPRIVCGFGVPKRKGDCIRKRKCFSWQGSVLRKSANTVHASLPTRFLASMACPSCTAFCECSPIQSGVFRIKHNYRHETDGAQVERSKSAKTPRYGSETYLKRSRSMRAGLKSSFCLTYPLRGVQRHST